MQTIRCSSDAAKARLLFSVRPVYCSENHPSGRYTGKTLLFQNKNRLIKRAAEYYPHSVDKRSGRAVIRGDLWTEGKAAR